MSETKNKVEETQGVESAKKKPLKTVFLNKKTSKVSGKNFYVAETGLAGKSVTIIASPLKNGDVVLNIYESDL